MRIHRHTKKTGKKIASAVLALFLFAGAVPVYADSTGSQASLAAAPLEVPVYADSADSTDGTEQETSPAEIVADTIAPSLKAGYSSADRVFGTKSYYRGAITGWFTIKEDNFFKEDVRISVSKDGGVFRDVIPEWKDSRRNGIDLHTGNYTIEAAPDHSRDGEYVFRVQYTDRSGNSMPDYYSKALILDTENPAVSVSYSDNAPENVLTDSEGHTRSYYHEARSAVLSITEHNFDAQTVQLMIGAKDAQGRTLDADGLFCKGDWKTSGDVHALKVTFPGDANYSFDVSCTDLAGNTAEDYKTDYFTVDTTAPENLSISCSRSNLEAILSAVSFGFYNAPVTVTISATDTISGIHSFEYWCIGESGTGGPKEEEAKHMISERDIRVSEGGARGTAEFRIPGETLSEENQFNGSVCFAAADRSGCRSEDFTDGRQIVADNIAPDLSVSYGNPVRQYDGISYYDGPAEAVIMVREKNFYSEDLNISVSKNGKISRISADWTDQERDMHTGRFRLTEDGEYIVSISYSDKSGNRMKDYHSQTMIVDTKIDQPEITINGRKGSGRAFRGKVIPAVKFSDKNYSGYSVRLTRSRWNRKEEDLTEELIGNVIEEDEGGGHGIFDVIRNIPENDGIYTLTVTVRDRAGHKASSGVDFTVNRYGSVYVFDDYLNQFTGKDMACVRNVERDLVITEYNPDKLSEGSLNIAISRDGKMLKHVTYASAPAVNRHAQPGENGWYQYTYTISSCNFSRDGVYKVSVSSKDETGNRPETENYTGHPIHFCVDTTPPEITGISGLENSVINAQEVKVQMDVYDAVSLSCIRIYIDGAVRKTISDFRKNPNQYRESFLLKETGKAQKIRITAEDQAGNIIDTDSENFRKNAAYAFSPSVTVSTNPLIRMRTLFVEHAAAFILSGAAAALTAAFAIWRRKRRRNLL